MFNVLRIVFYAVGFEWIFRIYCDLKQDKNWGLNKFCFYVNLNVDNRTHYVKTKVIDNQLSVVVIRKKLKLLRKSYCEINEVALKVSEKTYIEDALIFKPTCKYFNAMNKCINTVNTKYDVNHC